MCGIAGLLDSNGILSEERRINEVDHMMSVLAHRGPDDSGIFMDSPAGVVLGHRRLSIVDLSPTGHQPMTSKTGRWTLVYNGELYNAAAMRRMVAATDYRGSSDTEVLLECIAAHGVEATLALADGMFAIAAWDSHDRVLWLARDRFGEKPLYYGFVDGVLSFASELKGFTSRRHFNAELDEVGLSMYLSKGYISAPQSIFKNIFKVEAGTAVRFVGVNKKTLRYWDPVESAMRMKQSSRVPSSHLGDLETLFSDSVKSRLSSDVPVGAFLSGGIDSSLVVAMMARHVSGSLKTFSIGFEDQSFDESSYAQLVARRFDTSHQSVIVGQSEMHDVVPRLPEIYSEPFADSSQIPSVILSKLAGASVKVALSGDGGDEFFVGTSDISILRPLSAS